MILNENNQRSVLRKRLIQHIYSNIMFENVETLDQYFNG